MTHTSTEQPELLPCPFCGGKAGETHYQLGWFVACEHECSASTQATKTREQAIAAWNRRAPAPQAQRKPLSDAQIASACLSYRHDFGLLPEDERKRLMLQAREWERALGKASKAA